MPHLDESVTAIQVAWQLARNGVSPEAIPVQVGRHRATICRWFNFITADGKMFKFGSGFSLDREAIATAINWSQTTEKNTPPDPGEG